MSQFLLHNKHSKTQWLETVIIIIAQVSEGWLISAGLAHISESLMWVFLWAGFCFTYLSSSWDSLACPEHAFLMEMEEEFGFGFFSLQHFFN